MRDVFTIHSSALPSAAQLAGFHGSEGLSRLYRFDIFLVMTHDLGHDFDLHAAVGAQATLRLERRDGRPPVFINGIFATVELISDFLGRSVFRATLVPRLFHLTQSLHSRLFTQQTLPSILESVLQKGGLSGADYALSLLGNYPVEEHVCQYHESDFDFISRWMERDGLYYYFEQGDGEERLIITDHNSSHTSLGDRPVRYFPQAEGAVTAIDSFRSFTCRHVSLPASVRLKDYDYARPTFEVAGRAPVSPRGVGEISVHGGRFFSPDEGLRLAKVKAQGLLTGEIVYHGQGGAADLRSGYTFELEEHPRPSFNTRYLTTGIEHWANQTPGLPELASLMPWDDSYRAEVTAIAADVQYRAPQETPWPRIYGAEHAVVDGPATSEYAQIDSHGRYAVKFHFDESDLGGGQASTWVRMLQPHGGGIEGFHFPLRAGTEVVCTFAGGDPDRPAIVGVAPNALTPSPVTSGNNTRNVIQTGGRNRLELEDKAGLQRITLSTPHANSYIRMGAPNADHTFHIHTDGNALKQIGGDLEIDVTGNLQEYITGTTTETYKGDADTEYVGTATRRFDKTKTETVVGDVTENHNANFSQTVGSTMYLMVGAAPAGTAPAAFAAGDVVRQEIFGDYSSVVHGNFTRKSNKNSNDTTTGDLSSTVNGSSTSTVNGHRYSYTNGTSLTHVLGGTLSHVFAGALSLVEGGTVSNVLGGAVSATEGGALNAVAGVRANFTLGPQFSWNLGTTTSLVTGLVSSNVQGSKFETIVGIKAEYVVGFAVKAETVKFTTRAMAVDNATTALRYRQLDLATRTLGVQANDLLAIV